MQPRLWMSAIAFVLTSSVAVAQTQVIALVPDQVKWGPAPGLPADWQAAALMGDSTKAGPYVSRVKLPPNAMIPPHTHPDNENITVLSGSFGIGEGEVADRAKGRVLQAGSFYYLPAGTAHFAWAGPEGATIQIHGIGPSGINMIHH